ncbi:MAG: nicotinamide riboside transporter PnuC [Steroidobacteraceae bacterium]
MPVSLTEWIAVVLALAYVVLATRQNRWCWPAAGVSCAIYLVLFARAGLPMQVALQAYYVVMAFYGWHAWRASHHQDQELPVTVRPLRWHVGVLAVVTVLTVVNGRLTSGEEPSLVPYVDSAVAWGSVVATWLMTRKVMENWLYWIVFDLLAAGLYFSQGFYATTVLFLIYVVLAVRGYFEWRADAASDALAAVETSGGIAGE